jgi:hypothetical protein
MCTIINNLKTPYYYCLKSFEIGGTNFWIGWEYPISSVERFRDINKNNFKLVDNVK